MNFFKQHIVAPPLSLFTLTVSVFCCIFCLCLLVDVFTLFTFKIIIECQHQSMPFYHLFSVSFLWFWFLFLISCLLVVYLNTLKIPSLCIYSICEYMFLKSFVFVALSITVYVCDIIYWYQHFTPLSEIWKLHIPLCF